MQSTIAQTESSNSDCTSVGMTPVFSSSSEAKSPTPSISSFFGRIRSPVVSPASSSTRSRVSSHAPSIGPPAHAGRACEDVDEESRLNKEMTQEMNTRLMGLEGQIETLKRCIEQQNAELKMKEATNTENESELYRLHEHCDSLRHDLALSLANMEELQADCKTHQDMGIIKKEYEANITQLQSCIRDMEDKIAEMKDSSLLDGQTIDTMTDEIADLMETHDFEIAGLRLELASEQSESERESAELKQQELDLQELKAKVEQDNEIPWEQSNDELLLEKVASAESELNALKSQIVELKGANDALQKKHMANLQAGREQIDKAQKDLDSLKQACHIHQAELALRENEVRNLRVEMNRKTNAAAVELNNVRLDFGSNLETKDAEINKVKTELAAKKDFILKLLTENVSLKADLEKLSDLMYSLKDYAEMMAAAEAEQGQDSMTSRSPSNDPVTLPRAPTPKNKGTSHIKAENKQLKGKVSELVTEREQSKAQIASLEAELESFRSQLALASHASEETVPINHQDHENVSTRPTGFDNPFLDTLETLI